MKLIPESEQPAWLKEDRGKPMYEIVGELPDGRLCALHRLLYHWTILIDLNEVGYEDRYCYHNLANALATMMNWDGIGDPTGWNKHPATGRYRDPATGKEWLEGEKTPANSST